jgi:hypothetical protein
MHVTDLSSPETIFGATKAVRLGGDAGPTHRGLMNLFTWFHLLGYKLQVAGYMLQVAAAGSASYFAGSVFCIPVYDSPSRT